MSKYSNYQWICDGWKIECVNKINNHNSIWFGEISLCKNCFESASKDFQEALNFQKKLENNE